MAVNIRRMPSIRLSFLKSLIASFPLMILTGTEPPSPGLPAAAQIRSLILPVRRRDSTLAVVKLKPAKQYLRDYFLIPDDATAFQENDLMLGIRYLIDTAIRLRMPLVICISLGSNQGSHTGNTPLEEVLSSALLLGGTYVVAGTGNEAGMSHHYYGKLNRCCRICRAGASDPRCFQRSHAGILGRARSSSMTSASLLRSANQSSLLIMDHLLPGIYLCSGKYQNLCLLLCSRTLHRTAGHSDPDRTPIDRNLATSRRKSLLYKRKLSSLASDYRVVFTGHILYRSQSGYHTRHPILCFIASLCRRLRCRQQPSVSEFRPRVYAK